MARNPQFHLRIEEQEHAVLDEIREKLREQGVPEMDRRQDVVRYILRKYIREYRETGTAS